MLGLRLDSVIIDQCLKSLVVIPLRHHLNLVPSLFALVFLIRIDVKGLKEILGSGAKQLPILSLIWGGEGKFERFAA